MCTQLDLGANVVAGMNWVIHFVAVSSIVVALAHAVEVR